MSTSESSYLVSLRLWGFSPCFCLQSPVPASPPHPLALCSCGFFPWLSQLALIPAACQSSLLCASLIPCWNSTHPQRAVSFESLFFFFFFFRLLCRYGWKCGHSARLVWRVLNVWIWVFHVFCSQLRCTHRPHGWLSPVSARFNSHLSLRIFPLIILVSLLCLFYFMMHSLYKDV